MRPTLCLLTFSAVILCSSLSQVNAIRCYSCHSDRGYKKNCALEENFEITECRAGESYCTKIILDGEITRACSFEQPATESCRGDDNNRVCVCAGDLCNAAPASVNHLRQWLSIVAVFFVAKLIA